jgi:predicted nucleic acid-binding protein
MNTYYDTGILLKLYTTELESTSVQRFVHGRGEPIRISDLHHSECVSALRLKQFRGECEPVQSKKAIALLGGDLRDGTLRLVAVDWGKAWSCCRDLSERFAAETGARTLDALHVACAIQLEAREFVSSDKRQIALAEKAGLEVVNPTAE